uniref:Uncharacterized protein n=1 Tax=Equus asinus asinus TaxID=83772 RepID=A0A8C4L6T7_EQUAS
MSQVQGKEPKGLLGKSKMAMDVLHPLRQVLDSGHAVQQSVPASLASGFLFSAPVASTGAQTSGLLGPLSHLSSFALNIPPHSLLPPLNKTRDHQF